MEAQGWIIKNAVIYSGRQGERIPHGYVRIDSRGKIDRVAEGEPDTAGETVVDAGGRTLIPGMIDVHLHGGNGCDVMHADWDNLDGISRYGAEHGTTSFLATTGPGSREEVAAAAENIGRARERGLSGAELLGAHLEGPFLNPLRKGAMTDLRMPNLEEMAAYLEASGHTVRLVTLAPELPGGYEMVDLLHERGVRISIGHSDATYEQVVEAVRRGCRHTTHHFNGMRPLHHREPGVAGAGLAIPELTVELIADGVHVHPAVVRLLFRIKPADRICVITDAVRYAGMPDGVYGPFSITDGTIRLTGSDTLAGSSLTMIRALRNVLAFTGLPLEQVLPAFTLVPAREAGAAARKGTLEPGMDADFLVLGDELQVDATYVRGRAVYERREA